MTRSCLSARGDTTLRYEKFQILEIFTPIALSISIVSVQDDYQQTHVNYTCQDGFGGDDQTKGFFDHPRDDDDWPRCSLAPTCPHPPDQPIEGYRYVTTRTSDGPIF